MTNAQKHNTQIHMKSKMEMLNQFILNLFACCSVDEIAYTCINNTFIETLCGLWMSLLHNEDRKLPRFVELRCGLITNYSWLHIAAVSTLYHFSCTLSVWFICTFVYNYIPIFFTVIGYSSVYVIFLRFFALVVRIYVLCYSVSFFDGTISCWIKIYKNIFKVSFFQWHLPSLGY